MLDKIIEVTGFTLEQLKTKYVTRDIQNARMLYFYKMRTETKSTHKQIA